MANKVFKERFDGKYDGVAPATLLAPGWVSGGQNVRKVAGAGAYKARKGCALHNTTVVESGNAIKSLHQFSHPRNRSGTTDYHFIAQCNSKLLIETAAAKTPPAVDAAFGTTLGVTVGTTPGFSTVVKELWFYADGSGRPVVWGGDNPWCSGFICWDNSETAFIDYTRRVTDNRTDTFSTIPNAASDLYYVCSPEPAEGITLDLSTVNTTDATTIKVYAWRAGAWVEVTGMSDGTLVSGTHTHGQDGTITWTRSASDQVSVISNIMGYWYKVVPQAALTDAVTVLSCKVNFDANPVTNKWNGVWEWVSGCRFFDTSAKEYIEALGKVSNEAQSQYIDIGAGAIGDFLYIKTPEPAAGFGFGIATGYNNPETNTGNIDLVEVWNGSTWEDYTTITDRTLDTDSNTSFSQTGTVFFTDTTTITPQKREFEGDTIPGYWYRVSWDAELGANVRIYIVLYAPLPEALPEYDGVVEFKGRLFMWGDPEYPNRMRYSAYDYPDCVSGRDSGWTDPFGGMDKVLCAIPFYNELIVFKERSIWLLEGYSPDTFGVLKIADRIGLASPKTAHVVEVGYPAMHTNEPLSIAIWQDVDGIYVLDGRKPRKASMSVDQFFNPEFATAIAAADIRSRQGFTDPINNEYHFLTGVTGSEELVYNYVNDEWYPPWSRSLDISTGLNFRGNDDRYYTYGATAAGWICRLETDTADKNAANADVAITHSIKTRAFAVEAEKGLTLRFLLRKIFAELKARAAGDITTKLFPDMASSGTTLSAPQALSMIDSGKTVTTPYLDVSQEATCFQVEFSLAVIDQEMEIWGMLYELDIRGYMDSVIRP